MAWNWLARRAAKNALRIKNEQRSEDAKSRAEQMGYALNVRDNTLWNPFEVIAEVVLIIFAFGFLLGRSHYLFVAELFFPVIVIGVAIVIWQIVQRWRAAKAEG